MPQENRETSGAATPKVTVNLSRDPIFNKEEVLGLVAGFKGDDSLLQKRHLQRHRRNGFLRKLCVLRDRFLNRGLTDRKSLGKRRKFRH
nr:MAG TPA: hypothetical protein [Caudoviricetes sp.]